MGRRRMSAQRRLMRGKRPGARWQPGGDLPGLAPTPYAGARIFSSDPQRNVGQPGIERELPQLPDARLIATLVDLGCPQWAAEQMVKHPSGRFSAVCTWCLVQDAAEGKNVQNALTGEWTSAKDLVDAMRAQYADARRVELISDRPDHTIGLWER